MTKSEIISELRTREAAGLIIRLSWWHVPSNTPGCIIGQIYDIIEPDGVQPIGVRNFVTAFEKAFPGVNRLEIQTVNDEESPLAAIKLIESTMEETSS